MQKMKKSSTKKRSDRAIAMEQERIAEQEAKELAIKKKKESMNTMKHTMLCGYGLVASIISVLIDYMGIVALLGFGLSYYALKKTTDRSSLDYKLAMAGAVLGGGWFIFEWVQMFLRMGLGA